jgi:hypothetical protein
MWVAYARTVLGQALAGVDGMPPIEPSVVEQFETWLDSWEGAAIHGPEMTWSGDVDTDELVALSGAFLEIAASLATQAEQRGYPISPPEGDAFYQALVTGLIEGLAEEGRTLNEVADGLRHSWPGFKDGDEA